MLLTKNLNKNIDDYKYSGEWAKQYILKRTPDNINWARSI